MTKLSKLRLHLLKEQDLEEKQMNALRGGATCSCYWGNYGGSSSSANSEANYGAGICSCSCYYENSGGASSSSNKNANNY
jgi:natural product precursor